MKLGKRIFDRIALFLVALIPFAWLGWEYEKMRRLSVTTILVIQHTDAIRQFRKSMGRYPTNEEWQRLYLEKSLDHVDYWGNDLVYARRDGPGVDEGFVVASYGKGGEPDTANILDYIGSGKGPKNTGGGTRDIIGTGTALRDLEKTTTSAGARRDAQR